MESAGSDPTLQKQSEVTKLRILDAARLRFSQGTYEGVSLRDIARDAGVDASLLIRYFGSKLKLFREVATGAFRVEGLERNSDLPLHERAIRHLMAEKEAKDWRQGSDPFRLLLCSISSVTAGPIVAQCFAEEFVAPIAAEMRGEQAEARAALIAGYILGFAFVRVALASNTADAAGRQTIERLLAEAVQKCVDQRHLSRA